MDSSYNQTGLYCSKGVVLVWALPVLTILAIIIRTISIKKHCPSSSKNTTSNLQLTDPSSSSPPAWDVFLSFYGKDTRRNFISHLYTALEQAGILTFKDDHALEKGQEISFSLLDAIRNSKTFIVVLSENYAHSPWCLDELAQILSCKRTKIQVVPVFYYVDPSDVRHQKGSFGKAFDGHKKRYSIDLIEKWKLALSEIAELSGYHLKKEANENESHTIQEILGNVVTRESATVSQLEKYLFGMDSVFEEIYQKLRMECDDVRTIGICGMGGIGKTKIAKAFYNENFNKFDISCFNENVNHHSRGSFVIPLLKQLLIDLLRKKDCKVTYVESRIKKLKQILHSQKALIVLDDLDQSNYSELLASLGNFFAAGSRIIITTRDVNLLNKLKAELLEVDIYMVKTLGNVDSLGLFSYHAFRKSVPPENFRELSLSFVTYAGGLPLALKVLGSSLLGRTYEFWKAKLEKVQEISENDIQKILKLSYDELDETEKAIFLDIAFFFVGKDKDDAVHVFKSCDFFPDVGIPILVDRCLLTIDTNNKFEMHNLIQDMGRKLGKNTRLFLRGDAWKDFHNIEGRNNKIEGFVLDLTTSTDGQVTTFLFERMPNLRLLHIINSRYIKGNFKNLFPKLRCIRWHSCPWTHIPSTFCPQKLIYIDMVLGKFKTLWKEPMPINQLNSLSCLYLSHCRDLIRLPEQLGDMKALKKIDVSFTAIEKLPETITHLKKLVELNLMFCMKLAKLPEQLGEMKGLKQLNAGYSAIEQLPDSITQLKELFMLYFSCRNLRKLPEKIGNVEGLRTFHASNSGIELLPDSFVYLVNLENVYLTDCKNLRSLPNSFWKLKLLKVLHLDRCSKLERLPEQLGRMQCLEELYASYTAIEEVPDSIGLLSRLELLRLSHCKKLKYVPTSIWNLTSIEDIRLHLGDIGTISLPNSVKNTNKLKTLHLSCNVRLCLPMILCLSSLESLYLTDEAQVLSSAKTLSLFELFNLRVLTLKNCTNLGSSLPELPLSLEQLNVFEHTSLQQLPDLSSFKQLKSLYIRGSISLQSIWSLPAHLQSLSVHKCTSLQDVLDLSVLKELETLSFTRCGNLKLICLKQSSVQAGQDRFPFRAKLPNMEVAEWFNHKSSGRTVTFDIPPNFGSNFSGLALWVVYTCEAPVDNYTYIRAVITNITESITENYEIYVHSVAGETQSSIQCITGEKLSLKSGDIIEVSIRSLMYNSYKREGFIGDVKVKMFGVHVIQN